MIYDKDRYFIRKALRSISKLYIVAYNKLLEQIIKPPLIRNSDQTLNKILEERCSVSRFGDGEFSIMLGQNIYFQNFSDELKFRLQQVIGSQYENHIVCIPYVLVSIKERNSKSEVFWKSYLNINRAKIYKLLDLKKEYFDSQVTRFYIGSKDKSSVMEKIHKFKGIWHKRDIVIVEGEKSRFGRGNDLLENCSSVKRIICPAENAFSKYTEILTRVNQEDRQNLILIALGPTATILAFDLSIIGYQAIDVGHIDIEYEWFLQGATEQVPIKNKYVGEVRDGTNIVDFQDSEYEKQVIARI